jgi:hypothetical protein
MRYKFILLFLLGGVLAHAGFAEIRVLQLVQGDPVRRHYPEALPTLLAELGQSTSLEIVEDPLFIESFEDPHLLRHPVCYVNYADRPDWTLTEGEVANLRAFLENGGFLYIDAGINAAFLRDTFSSGQTHSFAAWEVTPVLAEQFARVFPETGFKPLPRAHRIFRSFFAGLPDTEELPEAIRTYVSEEKWPDGTYSVLALHSSSGRPAVIATPILAMGWGRDRFDRPISRIGFRVREGADGLDERLQQAEGAGQPFEVTREDGLKDIVYCQPANRPAWVLEPNGRWRVFRYYHSDAINAYAHEFYTRLGINFFTYVFTDG